jgi:hypothetical protein
MKFNVTKKDGSKYISDNSKVSNEKLKSEPITMLNISDIPKFKLPYNTKIPKTAGWQYSKSCDIKAI